MQIKYAVKPMNNTLDIKVNKAIYGNSKIEFTTREMQMIAARLRSCEAQAKLSSERLLEIIQLRKRIVELEEKVSKHG